MSPFPLVRTPSALLPAASLLAPFAPLSYGEGAVCRLPVAEYGDKMKPGWIGQMAGVGLGGPTEFQYLGRIIPADAMPRWQPEMINPFHQYDHYVEIVNQADGWQYEAAFSAEIAL